MASDRVNQAQWTQRDLPAPSVRSVVAAIEESDAFALRVRREADRLGVTTAADGTVLADGAEWIWNLAGAVVPQACGVLDIYHASEHIAAAAKALWGEGTLVNLRLKRTGARWRVEHVGPLVELIALADAPEWCSYWMAV